MFASVASLLAITVDRYIYIVKPLKYPLIVTRRRVFAGISGIWLAACCLFALWYTLFRNYGAGLKSTCTLSRHMELPLKFFNIYVPVTIIIILNFQIFLVSRKQRRKIVAWIIAAPACYSMEDHRSRKTRMRSVVRFFVGLKEAKTFSIVVVVLMFCIFVPTLVGTMLSHLNCNKIWGYWYLIFHYEFYGINSVVNTFIYGMRHLKYRKEFGRIFLKCTSCFKMND